LYSIQVSIRSGREDVALEEEVVILLQVVQHDVQRAGQLLDLLLLGGRQLVEVLVHRLARVDLVGDPVEAGHHARREGEVRVAGRIGRPELDALGAPPPSSTWGCEWRRSGSAGCTRG
jgi:hypothetical protein